MSIGIFDSGFGGLTVMKEIVSLLPFESVIYLADTARLPYGTKSPKTILNYSFQNLDFLLKKKIKLLVVACHTASTYALLELQKRAPIPVVGIISAGCREVVARTQNKNIAVIGTSATISSGIYQKEIQQKLPSASIVSISCPLFVSLVEEGFINHPITKATIRHYLYGLREKKVDSLLLACSHFPLLENTIAKTLGSKIKLVNPAKLLASEVKEELLKLNLLDKKKRAHYHYYVTDNCQKFKNMGELFLGMKIENVEEVVL